MTEANESRMSQVQSFRIGISDEALADLRARLEATRWIEDIFQSDWRYGAPVPFVRALCDHWLNKFNWRTLEARLNREQHVTTDIDGVTIHAMMRRSPRADAQPLMLLHGWPSSFLEFLDLYDPFTNPPPGTPAFHVITPSLPGYGFSTTRPGMNPPAVARAMVMLMERLGYDKFVVQGGDWGSLMATEISRQHPERVIGLHLNLVAGSFPEDRENYPVTPDEQAWLMNPGAHLSYPHMMLQARSPVSLAHAQNDSPAGLAAWIGEKFHDWIDSEGLTEPFVPYEKLLATIALYWFTRTAASAALMYYEFAHTQLAESYVTVPTAGAIFPKEVVKLPRSYAQRLFNIVQWKVYPHGGHFPALEHPDWLVEDLRNFADTLKTSG
jgi:pimeloyl-ACP methyl ester carboxylesterase